MQLSENFHLHFLLTVLAVLIFLPVATYANSFSIDVEEDLGQYVVLTDDQQTNLDISGDNTIEFWIKPESFLGDSFILNKGNPALQQASYYIFINNQIQLEGRYSSDGTLNAGNNLQFFADYDFVLNEWVHVAVSLDVSENKVVVYINGEEVSSRTVGSMGSSIFNSNADIQVGARTNRVVQSYFDGLVDEIRVWNDVRSIEEIRSSIELELSGDEEDLLAYWRFENNLEDDAGSQNLNDAVGFEYSTDVPFEGRQDKKFPLYTQIESPFPSLEETAGWADDTYAYGDDYVCGNTIAGCGCAITSLVMAAQNAGVDTGITGNPVNPEYLNAYLTSVGGYTSNGSLSWLAAQAFFGSQDSDGGIESRFTDFSAAFSDVTGKIDEKLSVTGEYAVLAYDAGHFVWLPKKTDDSYIVQDPNWYLTETANDVDDRSNKVRDYNNQFESARFIKIEDEAQPLSGQGIEAYLQGTAELLYEGATGSQVGYDSDGVIVVDLDSAWYTGADLVSLDGSEVDVEGKHLLVADAGDEFTLTVVGTEVGEYSVEFFTVQADGTVVSYDFAGDTYPGVETTFTFNLVTGEVVEEPISQDDIYTILDLVLVDASQQQKKFFAKQLDRLYGKADERTVTQTLQQISVLEKLFTAKKVKSSTLPDLMSLLSDQIVGSHQ